MLQGMSTKIPETIKEERLRWVLPIVEREIKLKDAIKVFPYSQRTLERWVANYKHFGEIGLDPKSTRPRTSPKETPIRIKERVIELRKDSSLCAVKLNYKLKKEGIKIHDRTVGKILKQENLIRKYRTRKIKLKYIKVPLLKGELVEVDIKYVPSLVSGSKYYQFTAIDCATRWRYLAIYESPSNTCAVQFLEQLLGVAPFRIRAVKTDNGSCFTNRYVGYNKSTDPLEPRLHAFDLTCQKYNIIHYLIDPGKPAQNGKVEKSHGFDQQHFYNKTRFTNLEELRLKTKLWNMYYNDLEHIALNGKTPNELIKTMV
jgi:transposase InsO family protein